MTRFALIALLLAGPAAAQTQPAMPMPMPSAAVPCPRTPPRLAPELAGWRSPTPLAAAASPTGLGAATLTIGHATTATLMPADKVAFPLRPEHAPAVGTSSGLFAFTVTKAGRYRVALGAAAWVDVVKDSQTMPTSAHGAGPDCTGIRKMVDFPLQPGRYLLQLSGSAKPMLAVMVARLPA